MLTTIIYIIGTLSLHYSDINSGDAFKGLLLPTLCVLFFIFIVWQFIFYFSLQSFSRDEDAGLFSLLYRFWNLNDEIRENGTLRGSFNFLLHLADTVCFFAAVYYCLEALLSYI